MSSSNWFSSKLKTKAPIYQKTSTIDSSFVSELDSTMIEMKTSAQTVPNEQAATGEEVRHLLNIQSIGQSQPIRRDYQLKRIESEESIKLEMGFRSKLTRKYRIILRNLILFLRLSQIILISLLICISGFLIAIIPINALYIVAISIVSFIIAMTMIIIDIKSKYRKLWFVIIDMIVLISMILVIVKSFQYHSLLQIEKVSDIDRQSYLVKNFELYLQNQNKTTDDLENFSFLTRQFKLKNIDQQMKEKFQKSIDEEQQQPQSIHLSPLRVKRNDESSLESTTNEAVTRQTGDNNGATSISNVETSSPEDSSTSEGTSQDENQEEEEEDEEVETSSPEDSSTSEGTSQDENQEEEEEGVEEEEAVNEIETIKSRNSVINEFLEKSDKTDERALLEKFIIMEQKLKFAENYISVLKGAQLEAKAYRNEIIPQFVQKLYNNKYFAFIGQMIDFKNHTTQSVDRLRHLLLLVDKADEDLMPSSVIESIKVIGARVKITLLAMIFITCSISVLYLIIWGFTIPLINLII